MLGKAFRPWRQLPDLAFADMADSAIATCNWGEIGVVDARSLADTLRCVVRTAPGLCLRRAGTFCEQRAHVLTVASAFPFGEGGTDCEAGGDG